MTPGPLLRRNGNVETKGSIEAHICADEDIRQTESLKKPSGRSESSKAAYERFNDFENSEVRGVCTLWRKHRDTHLSRYDALPTRGMSVLYSGQSLTRLRIICSSHLPA